MDPLVSIILRSFNEGWTLRETLPALRAQEFRNWELIVIDSGSTDGSVELIRQMNPRHFIQIRPEEYNPSRVMNLGMKLAAAEFGIFLNADATPQGSRWLRPLVAALQSPRTAAVFGRQIPRPDCRAVYAHDYERCFGPERESVRWDHFFSMASSGLRKDIWSRRGFLESMQYSEDDEYTRWCRAQGYRVVYAPESVAMHSHNYTARQAYKRSFGEARALAAVWTGRPEDINWPRTVLGGWLNDARRDLKFCVRSGRTREWPHALRIRWEQRRAKLAGFRDGWKFYRQNGATASGPARTSESPKRAGPDSDAPGCARFTLDGSRALERHLAGICEAVRTQVQSLVPPQALEAIVLGGGYGRGEGGVLKTASGDQPYNDLEFYVFLRGNRLWNQRAWSPPLDDFARRLSPAAGLHVEFKVDSLEHLRRAPVTMFSYDLVSKHRVVWKAEERSSFSGQQSTPGSETMADGVFAGCERHLDAGNIPLHEATRLLFNRCTGLLLAKELLRRGELSADEKDFVGRNLAKARLALGDALLAAFGEYHWSCIERRNRLATLAVPEELPWLEQVRELHREGVAFKLHPARVSKPPALFRREHEELSELARRIWLWLESRRLNQPLVSTRDYAGAAGKCPETSRCRNLLLNVRTFGPGSVFDPMGRCYPRERLLNALPLLLWEDSINDLKVKRYLQNQLRTAASDWQSLVAAYKTIWPRFS